MNPSNIDRLSFIFCSKIGTFKKYFANLWQLFLKSKQFQSYVENDHASLSMTFVCSTSI